MKVSDLFRKYHYLIEDAFDLDEVGNLIEKDPAKVIESDELFHDLFVNRMSGVLKELYDPHAYEHPGVRDPSALYQPSWFAPFMGTGQAPARQLPTTRFVPRTATPQTATPQTATPQTGAVPQTEDPQTGAVSSQGEPRVAGQPSRIGRVGRATAIANGNFAQKAPGIMQNLMRDFNLKDYQAAAIVGNLGHESGGFRYQQELHPTVPGSRGGLGWAQWTGPRRIDFENYSKQNGLDPKTDEANYGFLKHEITTKYLQALENLRNTPDSKTAMTRWEGDYEGSGTKNYPSRMNYTNQALDAYNHSQQTPTPTQTNGASRLTTSGDTSKLNPTLLNTMHAASNHLPDGYSAELTSGNRPGSHVGGGGGLSQHASGNAMDVQIRGPDGKIIQNRGTDTTGMYGLLARAAHHELSQSNPEMAGKLAWGGNFGVAKGSNVADLMHYDLGGDRGQLAGMGSTPLANQVAQNAKNDNFIKATQTAAAAPQAPQQQATVRPPGSAPYSDVVGGRNSQTVLAQLQKLPAEQLNGQHVVLSPGVSNDKHSGDYSHVQQQFDYLKNAGAKVSVVGMGSNYGKENPIVQKMAQDSGFNYIPSGSNDGVHMAPSAYSGVLKQAIAANGAPTHIVGDSLGVGVNSAMNRLPAQKPTQMATATPPPATAPPVTASTPTPPTPMTTQVKYISNDVPVSPATTAPAPQAAAVAPVSDQSKTVQTSGARKNLRRGDVRLNETRRHTAIGLLRSL